MRLNVIVPTYGRHGILAKVAHNVHENTQSWHDLYFVAEPGEIETQEEIKSIPACKLIISKYPGNHTGAANTAYEETDGEFFIIANDDFNFHEDWDVPALKAMEDPKIGVVGLNDGSNTGFTAITLVRRKYIQEQSGVMDMPNTLYFPGYNHNYVDTEFSRTAMKRGAFVACPESVVEHMHWAFGKSKMDATYEKSNATSQADSVTYGNRIHLWQ
jgi:glycosyltransferase involved in cell wall biosynthesis